MPDAIDGVCVHGYSSFYLIKFFPSLSARAAAHFGCMVGRYFLVMPKTRWNISLNGERPRPTKSRPWVKCSGFNFARGSESPVRALHSALRLRLSAAKAAWLRAQSASYQRLAGPGGVQLPDLYTVIICRQMTAQLFLRYGNFSILRA